MKNSAFSILEVILAMAFFVIFSSAAIVAVLQGLEANRLGKEETVAVQFAAEGSEAVKSSKNQAYNNLITPNPTPRGVQRNAGNMWEFKAAGTSDVLASGKSYTRQVKIETYDANTKKATSTVSWTFGPARSNSIDLASYFTDWRKPLGNGSIVYGDTTTLPKMRNYDNTGDSFAAAANTISGSAGRSFQVRASPTKREAVAGYVDSSGTLQVMCYDGSSWSNEWSVTVGGTGTTRRFDIAYETNSGDVLVLYSRNVATTNELGYRTKVGTTGCGSANWSAATNLDPLRTSGTVHWVKMAWDRRASSNLIAAIWADAAADLSAMIWSGSGWVNEPSAATETSLEVVSAAQDVDDFDVEYESTSGDVLVVWANSAGANGTNGVRYRTCTGGSAACTWGAVTTPPTFADDAHNLDISANPQNDQMIFASIGDAGDDLQVGRWDGSAFANVANKDTTAETSLAGGHLVTTGWLISGATTRGIVVYNDNNTTNINYLTMTPGNPPTWSATLNFNPASAFGNPRRWYDIQMDPLNTDRLMLAVSDLNSDLFAKRLVMNATPTFTWSNSDGGAALEISLSQAIASPFSYAFWRQP